MLNCLRAHTLKQSAATMDRSWPMEASELLGVGKDVLKNKHAKPDRWATR